MTTMRVGTLNVRVFHRNPKGQASQILDLADRHGLAVLALQEARTVARPLHRQAKARGYKVVGKPRSSNAMVRDNLLLVRRELPTSKPHVRTWGGRWERAKRNRHKGLHPARRALFAHVAGVNVLVVHGPPRPHGPRFPKRRRASKRYYKRLVKLTGKWTRRGSPWVGLGDFNLRLDDARLTAVARQVDARIDGAVIDGLLTGPGVTATDVQRGKTPGWYDHPIVTSTLHTKE